MCDGELVWKVAFALHLFGDRSFGDHFAHGITQNITQDDVIIKRLVRTLAFCGVGLTDVHGPNTHNKKCVRSDLKIMTPWIRIVSTGKNLRSALPF